MSIYGHMSDNKCVKCYYYRFSYGLYVVFAFKICSWHAHITLLHIFNDLFSLQSLWPLLRQHIRRLTALPALFFNLNRLCSHFPLCVSLSAVLETTLSAAVQRCARAPLSRGRPVQTMPDPPEMGSKEQMWGEARQYGQQRCCSAAVWRMS